MSISPTPNSTPTPVSNALRNKLRFLYIGVMAVVIFFNYYLYHKVDILKNEKELSEQNYKAATDKIRILKTHDDSIEYAKSVYIAKAAELVKLNKSLSDELKREGGDTKFLAEATASIGSKDTIHMPGKIVYRPTKNSKSSDTTIRIGFNYNKIFNGGYRNIEGYTDYTPKDQNSSATLTKDELGLKLITGLKHDTQNGYQIFIRSDYPGFKVTDLEGAVLDPTMFQKPIPKRWIVGPSAGVQMDLATGKGRPYVGLGITYKIFGF